MKEGFAAHLLIINGQKIRSAVAIVQNGILLEIRPLEREIPFTRFYDGAISIEAEGAQASVQTGTRVLIWQLYPYDLVQGQETPQTRKLQIKVLR